MADPTFNREKADEVIRQWWGMYGVNQTNASEGDKNDPNFVNKILEQSDPERFLWDDKNSLIAQVERLLNRGASVSDAVTILGNVSAGVDWPKANPVASFANWAAGPTNKEKDIASELDKAFTNEAVAEQATAMGLELREKGHSDKEMQKLYEQFVGRVLPTTTAGLTLSGLDSTTATRVRNAINQGNGFQEAKDAIAMAFAEGLNSSGEQIDFSNEDTILKSLSNYGYNWGDKSTTTDPAARDLAIASLFLSKGRTSPTQFVSWLNNTFKDEASANAYLANPSQHQGTGTASGTTDSDIASRFSQDVQDQLADGSLKWKGWEQGSNQWIGQFTDEFGNPVRYSAYKDKTGDRINASGTSELIGPDETWQEAVARQRLEVDEARLEDDADHQEWYREFQETKQEAEMEYKEKVAFAENWYRTQSIANERAGLELKEQIAQADYDLAIILQNASASLQTGISEAQIASREKIAQMAYDEVTADTAARLKQAGLELKFQTEKWEDQFGLAQEAQALEEDKFEFNKEHLGKELAQKIREFEELSAAEEATFEQRFKFWNNLSAAEKATLDQQEFQFANLSAAEEKKFKQDMYFFQNISAADAKKLGLDERALDQDMFKFANISAVDEARLAQDADQFNRNLAESTRQFTIGEAGDTLRTQISTQPALMGAITDRDRFLNEMLSQGGDYLARAFRQYGQAPPTDGPNLAERVNALIRQDMEANAMAQMSADAANQAFRQAEYQKYMQNAAQSAQARWDEYQAANTQVSGGGTFQYANPNYDPDALQALQAAADEAQAKADYFSGTDYTDPTTGQTYDAGIFPQGVPDIGFQAAAAQPHIDAAAAAQAAVENYEAAPQFLTGQDAVSTSYTGLTRDEWEKQFGAPKSQQDWWNTVADQSAIQQSFVQPDLIPVKPMTSMEELVAMSRGFLSPAAQDVYFGGAARPRTGFGFALPSYQQLQRLTPEERDALNTAMLTEFNVPLSNAVYEERLRGLPTRTSAPAVSARPTQMFRRTPFRTTNQGLRVSTAPASQVQQAARRPMFRTA